MPTLEKLRLQLADFQLRDQIYFLNSYDSFADFKQKQLWETIAYQWEDPGYAISVAGGVWEELREKEHFASILDIGCGYGRHAVYLSKYKNITCDKYYGIDISENMLRRLLKYKLAYNFFPSAEFTLICMPAGQLPIEDNSIDFVLSSNVFIHMEKEQVKRTLAEVARVIKPGGLFIFENSFQNQYCPANILHNLLRRIKLSERNLNYLKQFSLRELNSIFQNSEFSQKCPQYVVKANKPALIPEQVGGICIPAAKNINSRLNPPKFLRATLATGYSIYSKV